MEKKSSYEKGMLARKHLEKMNAAVAHAREHGLSGYKVSKLPEFKDLNRMTIDRALAEGDGSVRRHGQQILTDAERRDLLQWSIEENRAHAAVDVEKFSDKVIQILKARQQLNRVLQWRFVFFIYILLFEHQKYPGIDDPGV